ncbi:MAG: substrate-binding domain-containing protein, partial [Clostridia bacterium]
MGAVSAVAEGDKIALITMDSIDQHWITLNEGAQKAAAELGATVTFMSPNTKDDAQQIECVNNAVAGGYQAIM